MREGQGWALRWKFIWFVLMYRTKTEIKCGSTCPPEERRYTSTEALEEPTNPEILSIC